MIIIILFNKLFRNKKEKQTEKINILEEKYFILKYKNENVALLKKTEFDFVIIKIYNSNLLPFGIVDSSLKDYTDEELITIYSTNLKNNFLEWLNTRQIPVERPNILNLMKKYNIKNKVDLSTLTLNLSLLDQYWTCPQNSNLKWEDVNFFTNNFSKDIGNILFDYNLNLTDINYFSPDITTAGMDPKKWIIDKDNNRYLIKTCIENEQTQANEAIASLICKKLNIPFVEYRLKRDHLNLNVENSIYNNNLYSISKCICNENHTMVHANMIAINNGSKSRKNIINFFRNEPDLEKDFDRMLLLDFILIQEDRNYNNYGFIIDNNTGKKQFFFLDNSNSLCYQYNNSKNILDYISDKSKVYNTHTEALKYIKDFSIINLDKIKEIDNEILEILNQTNLSELQKSNILKVFNYRVLELEKLINEIESERNNLLIRRQEILEKYSNTNELKKIPSWKILSGNVELNPSAELEYINLKLNNKVSDIREYVVHRDKILKEN